MLDSKHNVHSTAFQNIILEADIPSCHLENVEDVFGNLVFRNIWIHDILERPHFVLAFIIFCHEIL